MSRFLIEVKMGDHWLKYKLLTKSPNVHDALERLPKLVKGIENGIENARVKRLNVDVEVANAKIEITKIWGPSHVET